MSTNIAPHDWPGKEELKLIRVKMRLLGMRVPKYYAVLAPGKLQATEYFELPNTRQKQLYDVFRNTVNRDYNRRVK